MKNKKTAAILLALSLSFSAVGCGAAASSRSAAIASTVSTVQQSSDSASASSSAATLSDSELFTRRDLSGEAEEYVTIRLSGSSASADGAGVEITGGLVTISEEGYYLLTGSYSGQIRVTADESAKVQLILSNAQITNSGAAAIVATGADKLFLTLAEGTDNSVTVSGELGEVEGVNADAAIYARCDLTINGSGSLSVSCDSGHGIATKDDLKIASAALSVKAARSGLWGKDSVSIADGRITIEAGTDGIHSENTDKPEKGTVTILGGSVSITAQSDGIDASNAVTISGGEIDITAGGGAESAVRSYGGWGQSGASAENGGKGVKSAVSVTISGGSLRVDSADDAIHTDGDVTIEDGTLTLRSGDDGIHADATLSVNGGSLTVTDSYEGLEAADIVIAGGTVDVTASDDGLNAAGGTDGSGSGGFFGGGDPFAAQDASITISGGSLTVNADGDGIDSNGDLLVSGGTITVSGPTNSGNGALDYNGSGVITGGTLIAAGASGMAENFSSGSEQCSMLVSFSSTLSGGTEICVYNATGELLASFTPEKSYQCAVISLPSLRVGETYTVTAGAATQSITLSSTIYGSGGMGGMGGHGGFGGQGGQGGMGGGFGGQGGMGGRPGGRP